ncbi:MAG: hypothetical protein F6K35_37600 [Okeania sp. SIO2H7]|nr:hypothetical protein [Okeania sp. SIO2H7]
MVSPKLMSSLKELDRSELGSISYLQKHYLSHGQFPIPHSQKALNSWFSSKLRCTPELARSQTDLIQPGKSDPVWSPKDALEAADTMLKVLKKTKNQERAE